MSDILNVAVYKRFRSDGIDQWISDELVKVHYKAYVSSHPNWKQVGFYRDTGNGTNGLQQLLQDCEAGQTDLIITKSVSRFAGNLEDCLCIIRKLKKLDPPVGIYFECEGLNSLNDDAEEQLLLLMRLQSG